MILTRVAKSISNSCLREIWFIGNYHPKGMPKEGNLFARFFSGLALPSLRYQASRIRGQARIQQGSYGTPLAPPSALMLLTSSDPLSAAVCHGVSRLSSREGDIQAASPLRISSWPCSEVMPVLPLPVVMPARRRGIAGGARRRSDPWAAKTWDDQEGTPGRPFRTRPVKG